MRLLHNCMQDSRTFQGAQDCANQIFAKEGVAGFYTGVLCTIIPGWAPVSLVAVPNLVGCLLAPAPRLF